MSALNPSQANNRPEGVTRDDETPYPDAFASGSNTLRTSGDARQAGNSRPSSPLPATGTRRRRNLFGISWLPIPNQLGLAPVLVNTGSVARDHLALERTFLAWLRTSLGLVSLGIAITQLFKIPEIVSTDPEEAYDDDPIGGQDNYDQQFAMEAQGNRLSNVQRLGKPIGGSFIALGMVVLLFGALRFFTVQRQLVGGKFSPSRVETSATALLVGAMIIAAFGVVVGMRLGASPT